METEIVKSADYRKYIPWLAALFVFMVVLPFLLTRSYHLHLLNVTITWVIIGLGLYYCVGLTGIISVAAPAFWGIGAYTSALLAVNSGVPFWIGILAATAMGAVFGFILGLPTLRVSGIYLAMVTIGFLEVVRLIIWNWEEVTRGSVGLGNIPRPTIGGFEFTDAGHYYYIGLAVLIILLLITVRVKDSRIGRAMKAIKQDDIAAASMGINVAFYKCVAFSFSAAFAGAAGALYAHFVRYINPDVVDFEEAIRMLAMVVLGGAHSIVGVILGSSVVFLLPEVLRFLEDYYMAIFGLGLVIIVVYMPEGIIGIFTDKLYPLMKRMIKRDNQDHSEGKGEG